MLRVLSDHLRWNVAGVWEDALTDSSPGNAGCKPDILLFKGAKQQRSCIYLQGHLLTMG